jgi:hypothetical protein
MLLPVVIPIGAGVRDELVLFAGRLADPEQCGPGALHDLVESDALPFASQSSIFRGNLISSF